MYRAITIQSKDVVDLLLRGETYRCDITKSRTKYFSDTDYHNCKGLAPIYIYMDRLSIADFYRVMSKVKLYHVAVGKHDLVRTFIPRVPESANQPEDTITPRICFAESLEGCLSAIGHAFYYPGKPELLTVWEYDADTRYCIPPEYLYDKGLVMDSLHTREWWVLQPLTLTGKYVNLVNFETTPYRIPDESKKQEVIQYIKSSALNFDDTDMALLQKSNIHEILYKVLGNWDRYHIDEEDVADFVGLDNCKFEEAYNVK